MGGAAMGTRFSVRPTVWGVQGYVDLDSSAGLDINYSVQLCTNCAVKIHKCAVKTEKLCS